MMKLFYSCFLIFTLVLCNSCERNQQHNVQSYNENPVVDNANINSIPTPVNNSTSNNSQDNTRDNLISIRSTTVRYTEESLGNDQLGIPITLKYVVINSYIKNNSTKTISKIYFSVIFRDKSYSASDISAPNLKRTGNIDTNINPDAEQIITYNVLQPDDINMVYSGAGIERLIYTDGSFYDF